MERAMAQQNETNVIDLRPEPDMPEAGYPLDLKQLVPDLIEKSFELLTIERVVLAAPGGRSKLIPLRFYELYLISL